MSLRKSDKDWAAKWIYKSIRRVISEELGPIVRHLVEKFTKEEIQTAIAAAVGRNGALLVFNTFSSTMVIGYVIYVAFKRARELYNRFLGGGGEVPIGDPAASGVGGGGSPVQDPAVSGDGGGGGGSGSVALQVFESNNPRAQEESKLVMHEWAINAVTKAVLDELERKAGGQGGVVAGSVGGIGGHTEAPSQYAQLAIGYEQAQQQQQQQQQPPPIEDWQMPPPPTQAIAMPPPAHIAVPMPATQPPPVMQAILDPVQQQQQQQVVFNQATPTNVAEGNSRFGSPPAFNIDSGYPRTPGSALPRSTNPFLLNF